MPRVNVKDQRKHQLIDANLQCIARLGLEHTTIADVSKAAEMSRGIVNFYFESKDRMMLETLKSLIAEYQAQLDKAVVEKKGDALEALISAHFQGKLATQKWLTNWFAFIGQAATQKDYRKLVASAEQRLLARFDGVLPVAKAQELLSFMRGCWLSLLLSPDSLSKEEMMAACRALASGQAVAKQPADVVELATHKPAPVQKKKKEEAPAAPQLDFGDLFSNSVR